MYTTIDFKSKKQFKEAVAAGANVGVFDLTPFGNHPFNNGSCSVEGPHYPKPHTWYARVEVRDGKVVKVK